MGEGPRSSHIIPSALEAEGQGKESERKHVCKFVSLSSFSGIMARHAVPLGFECAFILALFFKMIFPRTHSLYTLCHFKTSMPLVF
jgi:hypothetical protein